MVGKVVIKILQSNRVRSGTEISRRKFPIEYMPKLWKSAGSTQSYCNNKKTYFFGPPCTRNWLFALCKCTFPYSELHVETSCTTCNRLGQFTPCEVFFSAKNAAEPTQRESSSLLATIKAESDSRVRPKTLKDREQRWQKTSLSTACYTVLFYRQCFA